MCLKEWSSSSAIVWCRVVPQIVQYIKVVQSTFLSGINHLIVQWGAQQILSYVFLCFLKLYVSVSGNCISQVLKEYFHFEVAYHQPFQQPTCRSLIVQWAANKQKSWTTVAQNESDPWNKPKQGWQIKGMLKNCS